MKKWGSLLLGGFIAAILVLPAGAEEMTMSHWAQIRDASGNVIGRVEEGEEVSVLGICEDTPYRSEIYYPKEEIRGTVASVYIYGGTEYEYENPVEYTNSAASKSTSAKNADGNYSYDEEGNESGTSADYSGYAGSGVSIEINLSSQLIYVYQGGELVLCESCVTGTEGYKDTPTGEFTILDKVEEADLDGGIDGDGTLYTVRYWMPITEYGIGIHDAAWREGEFGGDIYEYDGSHGCINVDTWVAEAIFSMVDYGTPVSIYY